MSNCAAGSVGTFGTAGSIGSAGPVGNIVQISILVSDTVHVTPVDASVQISVDKPVHTKEVLKERCTTSDPMQILDPISDPMHIAHVHDADPMTVSVSGVISGRLNPQIPLSHVHVSDTDTHSELHTEELVVAPVQISDPISDPAQIAHVHDVDPMRVSDSGVISGRLNPQIPMSHVSDTDTHSELHTGVSCCSCANFNASF